MSAKCPQCDEPLRTEVLASGATAEACVRCAAAFFPRGALARALDREADLLADPPAHALDEGACPACACVLMKRVPFAPLLPLTVLRCPYCEGVFATLGDLPAMRARARAPARPAAPRDPEAPSGGAPLSLRQCLCALPLALVLSAVLRASPFARIILGGVRIPLHEFGHAVAAWLAGYSALPIPFGMTWIAASRSFVTTTVITASLLAAGWRLAHSRARAWSVVPVALLGAQAALLVAAETTRQAVITFAGCAGEIVFAMFLVVLFHTRLPTRTRWETARWMALAVGAFVLVDKTLDWRDARLDDDRIPWGSVLGEDGDMQRLLRDHGWTTWDIARRYTALAHAAFAVALAGWATSVARAWRARDA